MCIEKDLLNQKGVIISGMVNSYASYDNNRLSIAPQLTCLNLENNSNNDNVGSMISTLFYKVKIKDEMLYFNCVSKLISRIEDFTFSTMKLKRRKTATKSVELIEVYHEE